MVRMLVRGIVFLGSAAIGLLVASLLLDDVKIQLSGFTTVVVVYAVIQMIVSPFVLKMAMRHASAFMGGTGLVATCIALLIASAWGDALEISGLTTWVAATVVVWLVTAVATLALPPILVKMGLQSARARRNTNA